MQKLFKTGEVLVLSQRHTIDTDGYVFYVKEGYVCLYSTSQERRTLLLILKVGDIFPLVDTKSDYLSFVDTNTLEYESFPTAKVIRLSDKSFNSQLMDSPELVKQRLKLQEKISWLLLRRLVNFSENNVDRRLTLRLLYLADYLGRADGSDKVIIGPPQTYLDLARSISTTRESVNRLITKMQQEGILGVDNHVLTIKSISALRKRLT